MFKRRDFLRKRLLLIFLPLIVMSACVLLYLQSSRTPPKEQTLVEAFYAHRSDYERLRVMLQEDRQLLRVADWGVETAESVAPFIPPQGDFPLARYNEYLALLRRTGAKSAFRGREKQSGLVGVVVWARGWAGNTAHVDICWIDSEPSNQVVSFDDYYKNPSRKRDVFRHIEGSWYLWTDW